MVEVPERFAPSIETCPIVYSFRRTGRTTAARQVVLSITDREGTTVYENRLAGLQADGRYTYDWDGRNPAGHYVTPSRSPYTVTLAVGAFRVSRRVRVEPSMIAVWVEESPRLFMNDPDRRFAVVATAFIRKTDGTQTTTAIPIRVHWSFHGDGSNIAPADSHNVSGGRRLGKRSDGSAVFWEQHPDSPFHAAGNTRCHTTTLTSGADRGKAKVYFKPSGVGGDAFQLRARLLASDGTTELLHQDTVTLAVWRRLDYVGYEMQGQTHVSTHGTNALIGRFYTPNTFIVYALSRVEQIAAQYSVKYLGLWDHAAGAQKNWATWRRKLPAETPTAAETSAANGAAGPARDAARRSIETKAEAWRDRIADQRSAALRAWPADAGVPRNVAVAVEFSHPKYDADAPRADAETSEWSAFPWLQITIRGDSIHPDRRWGRVQGFQSDGRAFIFAGTSAARARVVIAHEAGHQSKHQFPRELFGFGDHSASPGLMDTRGSHSAFTRREREILKGQV